MSNLKVQVESIKNTVNREVESALNSFLTLTENTPEDILKETPESIKMKIAVLDGLNKRLDLLKKVKDAICE